MLLKTIALLSFLISFPLNAEGFSFSYGFKSYNINFQKDSILFNSKDMVLSLSNKPCFEERYKKFKGQLQLISSGVTLKKYEKGDPIKFNLKGELYGTEENSVFGQRLLALPRDMIKMKLIEKDLCQKSKKPKK